MPKRWALSPLFMTNDILLHVLSLKSAGLNAEYTHIDFESWTRISQISSQIPHFSGMLITISTALKLDVAGVVH